MEDASLRLELVRRFGFWTFLVVGSAWLPSLVVSLLSPLPAWELSSILSAWPSATRAVAIVWCVLISGAHRLLRLPALLGASAFLVLEAVAIAPAGSFEPTRGIALVFLAVRLAGWGCFAWLSWRVRTVLGARTSALPWILAASSLLGLALTETFAKNGRSAAFLCTMALIAWSWRQAVAGVPPLDPRALIQGELAQPVGWMSRSLSLFFLVLGAVALGWWNPVVGALAGLGLAVGAACWWLLAMWALTSRAGTPASAKWLTLSLLLSAVAVGFELELRSSGHFVEAPLRVLVTVVSALSFACFIEALAHLFRAASERRGAPTHLVSAMTLAAGLIAVTRATEGLVVSGILAAACFFRLWSALRALEGALRPEAAS